MYLDPLVLVADLIFAFCFGSVLTLYIDTWLRRREQHRNPDDNTWTYPE